MIEVKKIKARKILNSKGEWTVEVRFLTESGEFVASCPSGTSRGEEEAVERKDAVEKVNEEIASKLEKEKISDQEEVDEFLIELDGTKNKSRLGANALLPVSMAFARAFAEQEKMELWQYLAKISGSEPRFPAPVLLLVEGGLHGGGEVDTQEFMVAPSGKDFKEQLARGIKIYNDLADGLKKEYGPRAVNVGMEGGMTPAARSTEELLEVINAFTRKEDKIILDVAASHFYKGEGVYDFEGQKLKREELADFYKELSVWALEDPFGEKDEEGWKEASGVFKIGDDLTVTNPEKIRKAARGKLIRGVVAKPNQIGTVTETLKAVRAGKENDLTVFVKHRSGETNDAFIADLAVGVGAEYIMSGAPARGERVAKYNRLLAVSLSFEAPS